MAGCVDMQHPPAAEPVATQTISIPGPWVFEPAHAEVAAGVPVTFRNDGGADHTVTFEDIGFDVNIKPGESATYTFEQPGTYEYTCKYHPPDMKGVITVVSQEVETSDSSANSSETANPGE